MSLIVIFSFMDVDLNDFSNSEMYLSFYSHNSVNCFNTSISIFDDDINEADAQFFVIDLSIVYALNSSLVVSSRNVSIGRIMDNDRK